MDNIETPHICLVSLILNHGILKIEILVFNYILIPQRSINTNTLGLELLKLLVYWHVKSAES